MVVGHDWEKLFFFLPSSTSEKIAWMKMLLLDTHTHIYDYSVPETPRRAGVDGELKLLEVFQVPVQINVELCSVLLL